MPRPDARPLATALTARERRILVALSLFVLAASTVQTSVVPALPAIQSDLGVGTASIAWVLVANNLVTAVATPIVGRLGDMFGRRRMISVLAVLACLGCLVAALVFALWALVAGRALQGIGMASFAVAFAVVRDEIPVGRRAAAYGLVGAMWGVGASAGYPLGGLVAGTLSYQWIFWLGLAAIGAAGLYARAVVPPSSTSTPAPVDWVGAVAFSAGMVAVLLALTEGPSWGWGSAGVLLLAVAGAGTLVGWVLWELRVRAPLVDIRLLRLRAIWTVNVGGALAGFGMLFVMLLVPKLAQTPTASGYGFGDTVLRSGIYLLPLALLMLAASLATGPLAGRFGVRAVALAGAAASFLGFAQLAFFHGSPALILAGNALLGIGIGFNFSACAALIGIGAPLAQVGEANGVAATARVVGGALGAQVAATVRAAYEGGLWPAETGYTVSFGIAAAAAAVSFAAFRLTPVRPPGTA